MDDDLTRLPEDGPKSSLLSAGQTFGQYKVIRLLGRGGMGEVYEVENPVLEKHYALKLLNKEIMVRPDAAERFKREAKVMARFDHPNIVKVDDFGEIEGHAVLRMELVGNLRPEGGDLKPEVHSFADLLRGEPLPEALVVDLLSQILEGLAYAHKQGVVHRDLKPSNILLSSASGQLSVNFPSAIARRATVEAEIPVRRSLGEDGSGTKIIPKISDFGLVRLAGEQWIQSQVQLTVARSMASSTGSRQADPDATRLDGDTSGNAGTSTQAMLGTFEFMSPEQKKGQEATAQSDLYAVGLIAFRMLTGQDSPGMETASQVVQGLNVAWDAWLIKVLKQKPEDRYESVVEMLEAMPESGSRRGDKIDGRTGKTAGGKSSLGKWFVVAAMLILLCGAGYYWGIYQPEQQRVDEEARLAVEVRLQAEEEARIKAEAEKAKLAEEARIAAEAEKVRLAEEARLKAEEEARLAAEAERLRLAEEASLKAERKLAEQTARLAAEAERARLAEEALLKAEVDKARLEAEAERRLVREKADTEAEVNQVLVGKEKAFAIRAGLTMQTLTDTQGRKVKVEILKVMESEVKIRRTDGLETTIPLNMLSEEDRDFCAYLRENSVKEKVHPRPSANPSDEFDWDAYFNS